MQIKGLNKTSLIDYPGKVACIVFTGGCNLRCPFCQNAQLVLAPEKLADLQPAEILRWLKGRRGLLDGVVISGGEPLLQGDLAEFISQVRELGMAIKLDTNGYASVQLQKLLHDSLLDFVAMDIKSVWPRYPQAAGLPIDVARIRERISASIAALLAAGIAHEFRTTVVPGIVEPEDVGEIAAMISGTQHYALQQYRPAEALDPGWRQIAPYPAETLRQMAARLSQLGVPTDVRGI
jgi:pyruvate formate lyase activating enzyme